MSGFAKKKIDFNDIARLIKEGSETKLTFNDKTVCNCSCHKNKIVMHCVPCCDLTYETYINDDDTLDEDTYKKLKGIK